MHTAHKAQNFCWDCAELCPNIDARLNALAHNIDNDAEDNGNANTAEIAVPAPVVALPLINDDENIINPVGQRDERHDGNRCHDDSQTGKKENIVCDDNKDNAATANGIKDEETGENGAVGGIGCAIVTAETPRGNGIDDAATAIKEEPSGVKAESASDAGFSGFIVKSEPLSKVAAGGVGKAEPGSAGHSQAIDVQSADNSVAVDTDTDIINISDDLEDVQITSGGSVC